jgi:nuclear protein localization family protein 4
LLCRAATVHAHSADRTALEELFASNGWKTLLTIAESTRMPLSHMTLPQADKSATQRNGGGRTFGQDRSDTPSQAFDDLGINSPARPAGGGDGGPRVCPHCTFVNEGSGSDCDICGLPLGG